MEKNLMDKTKDNQCLIEAKIIISAARTVASEYSIVTWL